MKRTALVVALMAAGLPLIAAPTAKALPGGFQIRRVIDGLVQPTSFKFADDGRVFIAEKNGYIKVYDSINDTTPTIFADLTTNVYSFLDRGLMGIELHPDFPATPYVYALYAYDAEIGGTAPRWGTPGVPFDTCPTPPGALSDGCIASARLVRLEASGDVMTGPEHVLIEDWCGQFPSHTVGTVRFGPDGALYVGGGDGAKPQDYGQFGSPLNPCDDPPGGRGAVLTPPTAEGGALRAQDLRTPGDPVTLDGTIIRVDPITGAAAAGNPLASHADANARRIIAYGMRNPFRFAFRPGTQEIYVADVGEARVEEINRIPSPTDSVVENFGWPCYEGAPRFAPFDNRDIAICEQMYGTPATTGPWYTYQHGVKIYPEDPCPGGGGVISALGFYESGNYPETYDGALFFGDYSRACIWVMLQNSNGIYDRNNTFTFAGQDVGGPVDMQVGPNGDLFYLDVRNGRLKRIQYFSTNQPPTAVIAADNTSGPAPLEVQFDATGSTDPEEETLTYEWDLDGDGQFNDSTSATPAHVYLGGETTVGLRVTDPEGERDTEEIVISAGNNPPTAEILFPQTGFQWHVGEQISFGGLGEDFEDGTLPASAMDWSIILHHCPDNVCHEHPLQGFEGVAGGSFPAADHEYPSHLEVRLTVRDEQGLEATDSVELDPETTQVTLASSPQGMHLEFGAEAGVTPYSVTAIVGSSVSVTAPDLEMIDGSPYSFASWSDGGARSHQIVVPSLPSELTANYELATLIDVSITNKGFTPKDNQTTFPRILRWTNNHTAVHNVADNSGLGLYDSGPLNPGARFSFEYIAAGRYPFRSTLDPTTSPYRGSVSIPMTTSTTSGTLTTGFDLTWASEQAPGGYVYDVQILRPGATNWVYWRHGVSAPTGSFTAVATGTHQFQARMRRVSDGRASAYSIPIAVTVSS
jgi:glucose/arabinose dehydrogenase